MGPQDGTLEYLTCFLGGTLTLGAHLVPDMVNSDPALSYPATLKTRDRTLGGQLSEAWHRLSSDSTTQLPPEQILFINGQSGYEIPSKFYILRPEASETWFYR